MMGVRIASLLTTTSSSAPAALVSASPLGITFRSALANLSDQADAESGSTEGGAKSDSGSGVASKQARTQSSSIVRVTGASTTVKLPPSSTQSTVASVKLPGIPIYTAPTNSSKQENTDTDPTGVGSETQSGAGAARRIGSKQETAHSTSVVSDASSLSSATVPPADQPTVWMVGKSSGQDKVNPSSDESSRALVQNAAVSGPTASHDLQQPSLLPQAAVEPVEGNAIAVDPAERVASTEKQLNLAPPSGGSIAEGYPVSAAAIPSGMPHAEASIAAQATAENFTVPMKLPMSAALPINGDGSRPAGKADTKNANDVTVAKNSGQASTTDTGKSKSAESVSVASDGPSHGIQINGQSAQHSQTDLSQGSTIPAKIMDNGMSQAQATMMHVAPHETATQLRTGGGVEDSSRQGLRQGEPASDELDSGNAAATSGINAAKLIQTMGQTEMSVGMRSNEFGNISIRTSVTEQQMLAQISLDHHDLSQALSSHVSSMQTKLENDYGLRTMIEINHQGALSSGDSGNSAQREQKEFVRSGGAAISAVAVEPEAGLGSGAIVGASDGLRLDIRA